METYTNLKSMVSNPDFQVKREKALQNLIYAKLDIPIVNTVKQLNKLPCCFTLQCCYGHFVRSGYNDSFNLAPLQLDDVFWEVKYKIAYIALCLENSLLGRKLFKLFEQIPAIDPQNVQFCCAEWFWKNQVNSYVLQVEPDRYKNKDMITLNFEEAQHVEKTRTTFFNLLNEKLEKYYKMG